MFLDAARRHALAYYPKGVCQTSKGFFRVSDSNGMFECPLEESTISLSFPANGYPAPIESIAYVAQSIFMIADLPWQHIKTTRLDNNIFIPFSIGNISPYTCVITYEKYMYYCNTIKNSTTVCKRVVSTLPSGYYIPALFSEGTIAKINYEKRKSIAIKNELGLHVFDTNEDLFKLPYMFVTPKYSEILARRINEILDQTGLGSTDLFEDGVIAHVESNGTDSYITFTDRKKAINYGKIEISARIPKCSFELDIEYWNLANPVAVEIPKEQASYIHTKDGLGNIVLVALRRFW